MSQKIYQIVTDRITEMLAQGRIPWRRPWKQLRSEGSQRPRNFVTRIPYRGANWFLLSMLNFCTPDFLTFKQALALGGSVRKGETGFPVIFWKILEIREDQAEKPEDIGKRLPLLRYYTVFHTSQCSGLKQPEQPEAEVQTQFDPITDAEAIWEQFPQSPSLNYGGDRACYSPAFDEIRMPPRNAFHTAEGFYETLFHEAGHSTGHASRLNRKELVTSDGFGGHLYSQEELTAELTAAFLCAEAGIDQPVLANQAAYLQSWLDKLTKEPKYFVRAAGRAQKAADWILNRQLTSSKPEDTEAA
jgi:antirestriction protein ArdC